MTLNAIIMQNIIVRATNIATEILPKPDLCKIVISDRFLAVVLYLFIFAKQSRKDCRTYLIRYAKA